MPCTVVTCVAQSVAVARMRWLDHSGERGVCLPIVAQQDVVCINMVHLSSLHCLSHCLNVLSTFTFTFTFTWKRKATELAFNNAGLKVVRILGQCSAVKTVGNRKGGGGGGTIRAVSSVCMGNGTA